MVRIKILNIFVTKSRLVRHISEDAEKGGARVNVNETLTMTISEFNNLVLPAYGLMQSTARRLLGRAEDAADVVQDVMRRLWEMRADIDPEVNVAGYAVRAVHNRCVDIIRNSHPTVGVEELAGMTVEDNDLRTNELEALDRAICSMTGTQHSVLTLSLDGYSNAMIAEKLNLSESNVRQLLCRARKELRNKLGNHYE